MSSLWDSPAFFYGWWIFFNCLLTYFSLNFLFRFQHRRPPSPAFYAVALISMGAWIFLILRWQLPGTASVALSFLYLLLCPSLFLKEPLRDAVAPAAIVLTLSTFQDSLSAIIMNQAVYTINDPFYGSLFQLLLSGVLAFFYCQGLRLIAWRYSPEAHSPMTPYLYALLLPCAFIILTIRTGLGLDDDPRMGTLFGLQENTAYAFAWIGGALVLFFGAMEAFRKLLLLSAGELERARLDASIRSQKIYLEEAKTRNDQYRSFHHDIRNQFIVLTGLMKRQEFQKAAVYLEQLYSETEALSGTLSDAVYSENPVLDVLLSEKIRYAKQKQISLSLSIKIPAQSGIDDMDLCILFGNALDNAIRACEDCPQENRFLRVTAAVRQRFLIMEMENSISAADEAGPILPGTGLENVKKTAAKYGGTVNVEKGNNRFRISLLLCLPSSEPEQMPSP